MVDVIIILIVAVLLIFALRSSIKRFKGEKTCCGGSGGSVKAKKKSLDGPVIGTMTVRISGMHCDNCAKSVKNAIDKVDGVVAEVDYQSGIASVKYDRNVDESKIRSAVIDAGYKVESIN